MLMISWKLGIVLITTARTVIYKERHTAKTGYIDSVQGQVNVDFLIRTTDMSSAFNPVAFDDSIAAYQETITNYVSAGCLSVLIWDILDNLTTDYKALFKGRTRFNIHVISAYILSRIGTLGFALGSAIFTSAPTGNCVVFDNAVHAWCPITIGFSAYLFFLRLQAIYNRNPIIKYIFFTLWLGLLVATIFVPIGIIGGTVGPTLYCQDAQVALYVTAGQIAPLVFDTLVFVAISWRLCRTACAEMGIKGSVKVMILGKGLPAFTKSLLVDGQLYYLISVVVGLIAFILMFTPEIPLRLRPLANVPYVVVVNIMACRVFRRTRTGVIRESQISTSTRTGGRMSQLVFPSSNATNISNQRRDTTVLSQMVPTPSHFGDSAKKLPTSEVV
ncbi:hypothetical protein HYPSUDRAFT_164547 [Hypholoma sublateritium FD-334 SS-4]|uniref:G-protein coupled receptors family 1 profile domain-containing protein n=1 Tax=Hypholoma sublateritium (strain FD-334 SS-4) TaxID=945553 RepID=A0A0D2NU20_HYPSF|nr:hypothetical protein HYPSUDRAFT_164547 [Hypholoma sublateritium FD-334 SS-4]